MLIYYIEGFKNIVRQNTESSQVANVLDVPRLLHKLLHKLSTAIFKNSKIYIRRVGELIAILKNLTRAICTEGRIQNK